MRSVVIVLILIMGCRAEDRPPPERTEMSIIVQALNQLVSRQAVTGRQSFREAIEKLRSLACPGGRCGRELARTEDDLGAVTLVLLKSVRSEVREVGLLMACGLCKEEGKECACDGRKCNVSDMVPAGFHSGMRLQCGFVEVDGTLYSWGHVVAERL